jgi:hypothetical protein
MLVELDRRMEFAESYHPRILSVLPNGRISVGDLRHQSSDARLFHYAKDRFNDPVTDRTYWTDVEFTDPLLVNPVTGVPNGICRWRAEWRFPISGADKLVIVNEARAYRAHGSYDLAEHAFVEYTNWDLVQQADLIWTRLSASMAGNKV